MSASTSRSRCIRTASPTAPGEPMLAAYVSSANSKDPLAALCLGERPVPVAPEGWTSVRIRAAALNHHDLWSLRGVGLSRDQLPRILGTDGAGIDESGREVIVHPVIASRGWTGDETLDPARTMLSERYDGTLAETVVVPRRNLVAKPESLTFEEAACLPSAWLTAYRMLFTRARIEPGSTLLVQGTRGGMSAALITLAKAIGVEVWATATDDEARELGLLLGADAVFAHGAHLPRRVDTVADNIGADTWGHSVRSVRPGGVVVSCGATSGDLPPAELRHIYFRQLQVVGSTMGTRDELERLLRLVVDKQIAPRIDSCHKLVDARRAFARLLGRGVDGKVVVRP